MPRILVWILGALVGYVAYNYGARIRAAREITADSNGGDNGPAPITLAESIRRAVAEKRASQETSETDEK